ncbi:protein mono-ADP-ribosyltransferase PARP10 isoform X2 [Vidua chalybeata]|uniref:protein mono-ADP-ribosyltransferase PARP10 isoform X2 n=1 Tax=Vidua chalybeata TaxID=81927 RepID=UPI0023A8206E|nr:protein mono-ADP-ribosyltransferase PARP10 isoform X2 [Vidua chalybeata]
MAPCHSPRRSRAPLPSAGRFPRPLARIWGQLRVPASRVGPVVPVYRRHPRRFFRTPPPLPRSVPCPPVTRGAGHARRPATCPPVTRGAHVSRVRPQAPPCGPATRPPRPAWGPSRVPTPVPPPALPLPVLTPFRFRFLAGAEPCSLRMAGGVLEVQGVPPEAPEELLVLYFESRRRSGGGPVQSCQRLGPLLFLTFEDPQDAQNVLAHGSHRLGGAELGVRPAPPWDPSHLLLRDLEPRTPSEHLDLPLETLLGVPPRTVTLCQVSAPGWRLLRLQDPLTPPELAAAEQRARQRGLALLRAPRSPAVLVRAAGPAPSRDLLELYFENRRSGGGRVRDVRTLPGGRGAVVTFQEPAAAERVLQRPHRLQDVVLELVPHFPFLELLEASTDTALDAVPAPDGAPPPDVEPLLVRDPLVDTDCPPDTEASSDPSAAHTNTPPDAAPAAPTSPPGPGQPSAAFPSRDKDTEGFRAVPSQAQPPRPVSVVVPEPTAAALAQDEALVPAEPGAVRYLQQHYQDMLSSVSDVSLLPLEGGDVSGFRVSGEPGRCQAVADFLQSLLDSVASHSTTLRFPGVARFLWDLAGQSLLQQLESRFQCVIQLDGEPWSPPDPQLELDELLPAVSHREPRAQSWHQDLPEGSTASADGDGGGDGFHPSAAPAEEIKKVLSALRPSDADERGSPELWPGTVPGNERDHNAAFICAAGGEGAGELLSGTGAEDEEVQMALAIQYSMDRAWCEQEELERATALSLRSYSREQEQEQAEEDARLLAALEASLEEALLAADAAWVTVFCSFERDASSVTRELERALAGLLRTRDVASERLRALPAAGRCALALLRCRHAVQLSLRGDTATLRGFAEYTAPAAQDLASLLHHLPPPGHGATAATTAAATAATTAATAAAAAAHWVRWDPSGTAVPYAPETAALLEQAWLRQERRLDLVLDGRPFTVDLERMEEFDIGSARAAPVCRSQPPLDSTFFLLGPELAGLEEEVRLMALPEDSEEFADTVRQFCATLEELRGQISVVQVQKLIHPVLYKQYQLKKGSVKRACAAGTAVERVLFHGTTKASSCEICLHGFNRSFCGKNATLYGRGVYFAARAAISARDRYSPPCADGTKFVFMAKVLTGEFAAGRPGLGAPPLREGRGVPQRYHSVVDDPRQPDIFVIFNDTQAYPQYLITCRSRHGGPL